LHSFFLSEVHRQLYAASSTAGNYLLLLASAFATSLDLSSCRTIWFYLRLWLLGSSGLLKLAKNIFDEGLLRRGQHGENLLENGLV
jgi:hypothetical protein